MQFEEISLDVLRRTNYIRKPEHIVPRFTDETKQNFFLAVMRLLGFECEVEGDDVTPSLSQSIAISKLVDAAIVRRGKKLIGLKIKLTNHKLKGYSRHPIKVKVTHKDETFVYTLGSRGNKY